jgi:hypothetical protein
MPADHHAEPSGGRIEVKLLEVVEDIDPDCARSGDGPLSATPMPMALSMSVGPREFSPYVIQARPGESGQNQSE